MREKRTDNQDMVEIDLWKLLMVFMGRWKMIVIAAVLAAVLTFVYTVQFITPLYRAGIKVYVNNINANETIDYINASNLAASQQLVNTYVNMIRSNTVLEKVAESADFDYTAEEIRRMMTAGQVDETEIFELYITHPDPVEATKIANAIADVAPEEIAYFVEGSSTKIIDYARVPDRPYTPNPVRNTVLGGMMGCLLAMGYLFLSYILDVRIKDEEDLTAMFDIPLLGQIPNFTENNKNKDARYGYGQSTQGGEQE